MMRILVITGGIGSGKSEVCRILSEMGMDLQYNADRRVKELYAEKPDLLHAMEEGLGCSLRNEMGIFVPSRLAERIFSDRNALELVESLVFPALMADFKDFCNPAADGEIVVFESATLLEKPQFNGFGDFVVLVDAPFEMRLERACMRDGADKEAVLARMNNQKLMNDLSAGMTDPRIDAVILNDGAVEELRIRTKKTISVLLKDMNVK